MNSFGWRALFGTLASLALPRLAFGGPLDDLQPGEWYEVPNSNLDAVAGPHPGIGEVSCVMSCWAGGAFDPTRDRLYVTGGGHNGYAGNEIYAFDVNDLTWHRLNEFTPLSDGTECPDPNVAPCATHTYDGVEYLPEVDRFLVAGCCTPSLYRFDLNRLTWEVRSGQTAGNSTGNFSAYDPVTGLFFYHATYTGELASYDAVNDVWRKYGQDTYYQYYNSAAIDPKRRKFVAVGPTNGYGDPSDLHGKVMLWDISDPSAATIVVEPVTTSGDQTAVTAVTPGFDYDSAADRLVAWVGGADVYSLDLDDYSWEKHSPTNSVTPTAPNMNGTFGRFRYVSSKNVFVLVNNTNENVFFYKLGPGGGVPYPEGTGGTGDTGATGATGAGGTPNGANGGNSTGPWGGSSGSNAADPGDESQGCSCRAAGAKPAAAWALALLAATLGARAARRRTRPYRAHVDVKSLCRSAAHRAHRR